MKAFLKNFRFSFSNLELNEDQTTPRERFYFSLGALGGMFIAGVAEGLSLPFIFMIGATGVMAHQFYQELKIKFNQNETIKNMKSL